jgi:ribosomal protein S12
MKKQRLITPRKPNSGTRQMFRVYSRKIQKLVWVSLPGFRILKPKLNLNILYSGGRTKDIPGSRYMVVRSAKQGEVEGDFRHHRRPSIYGIKQKFRINH